MLTGKPPSTVASLRPSRGVTEIVCHAQSAIRTTAGRNPAEQPAGILRRAQCDHIPRAYNILINRTTTGEGKTCRESLPRSPQNTTICSRSSRTATAPSPPLWPLGFHSTCEVRTAQTPHSGRLAPYRALCSQNPTHRRIYAKTEKTLTDSPDSDK